MRTYQIHTQCADSECGKSIGRPRSVDVQEFAVVPGSKPPEPTRPPQWMEVNGRFFCERHAVVICDRPTGDNPTLKDQLFDAALRQHPGYLVIVG